MSGQPNMPVELAIPPPGHRCRNEGRFGGGLLLNGKAFDGRKHESAILRRLFGRATQAQGWIFESSGEPRWSHRLRRRRALIEFDFELGNAGIIYCPSAKSWDQGLPWAAGKKEQDHRTCCMRIRPTRIWRLSLGFCRGRDDTVLVTKAGLVGRRHMPLQLAIPPAATSCRIESGSARAPAAERQNLKPLKLTLGRGRPPQPNGRAFGGRGHVMRRDLTKSQRRRIRELAGIAYARKLSRELTVLEKEFAGGVAVRSLPMTWTRGSMSSTRAPNVSSSRRTLAAQSSWPWPPLSPTE